MTPYFINERIGFVWANPRIATYDYPIMRTIDGGATWSRIDTSTFTGRFYDIFFVSKSHGYAASGTGASAVGGGLYETFDTGSTWHKLLEGQYYQVKASNRFVVAVSDTIVISTDGGTTWNGVRIDNEPIGTGGYPNVVYNFENFFGVLMAARTGACFATTFDEGTTWTKYPVPYYPSGLPFRFMGPVCLPHSLTTFLGQEFRPPQLVLRNPELSNAWDTVLRPNDVGNRLFGEVEASGCAVYVGERTYTAIPSSGVSALFHRSTDRGVTWDEISAPPGTDPGTTPSRYFCVVSEGSVVYAIDQLRGYLWKTVDGGDGALPVGSQSGQIRLSSTLFSPGRDTVRSRLCDSAEFSFSFDFNGACSHAQLSTVRLEGISGLRYRSTSNKQGNTPRQPDTIRVVLYPTVADTDIVSVRVGYVNDNFEERDTVFKFVLGVSHNRGTVSLSDRSISFGAQAMCSAIKRADTIRISASGCEAVQVDSIVFRPADGASTDFGFTSPASFAIGSSDKSRAFPITFKPTHPAKESGWIFIYSSNGVDSIQVIGEGVADSRTFIADRDTLRVQMCDSAQGLFRLTNTTCGSLIIDSVALADGFTLPLASSGQPQLPLGLGRDQSETITLRYSPSSSSTPGVSVVSITAHVRYLGNGDTVSFDTVLTLPLITSRGIPAFVLSEQTLDLGEISTCSQDSIGLSILSTGCDTLKIQSVSLASAQDGLELRGPAASTLSVGASDSVRIVYKPQSTGPVTDTLIVVTNAGVRRVPITATGVAGTKLVAASATSIDFGSISICNDSSQSVTVSNKGCDTLTITAADIIGQGFAYDGSLPIKLKPGESTVITLHSLPDTTGHPTSVSGSLQFTSTAQNTLAPIVLSRSFVYPTHLDLKLTGSQSGEARSLAIFGVMLDGLVPTEMESLTFSVTTDEDLLGYLSATAAGLSEGASTGGTSANGDPVTTRTYTLSPVHTGQIAKLTYRTFLARSATTPITIGDISFEHPSKIADDCIASIDDSSARYTFVYKCGEGVIQQFLQKSELSIDGISPNPASQSLDVRVHGADRVILVDLLGRDVVNVPANARNIDVSQIPSGVYYLRATGGGAVRSARVVIER